jgi:hypothetical protein
MDESGAGAARPDLRRSNLKQIKILGPARAGDDGYVTAIARKWKSWPNLKWAMEMSGEKRCDRLRFRRSQEN